MAIAVNDLRGAVDERFNAVYIMEEKYGRQERLNDWRMRLEQFDALYRGDWNVVFPGEFSQTDLPKVQNIIHDALHDMADLVAETEPTLRCDPDGDSKTAEDNASIREAIGRGYWVVDRSELLVPQLAMDLIGTDVCFLLSYASKRSPYPKHSRLDPRWCLPNFSGNELLDLMTHQKIPLREAARKWPELGLDQTPDSTGIAEVVELYTEEYSVRVVYKVDKAGTPSGEPQVAGVKENLIGRLPISWARIPTFDGFLRGRFDQLAGVLNAKNRIRTLILDQTDQAVQAPIEYYNVENIEEFGPQALLRLALDGKIGRVAPAEVSPQLFQMERELDSDSRNGASYPASREGEVSAANPASASFISATQGKLTSRVRSVGRLMGDLRKQQTEIDFAIDEKELDEDKPMIFPIGGKKSYTPSKAISGNYRTRVIYPAGMGLDRLNQATLVNQDLGLRKISRWTARNQTDYLADPSLEEKRIDIEETQDITKQKFLSQASIDQLAQLADLQINKGMSFIDAVVALQKAQQLQQPQQPQGAPGEQPGLQGPTPPGAETTQNALQKGGQPGGPNIPQAPFSFAPPLTTAQIRVG